MGRRILLVGVFTPVPGRRDVCQDMAEKLPTMGWQVITTSSASTRLGRVIDMVKTTWRRRHEYDVAYVEVFSGQAFRWAEWVCRLLAYLQKPFVLTLHGGNLPNFAQKNPQRVSKLLRSAKMVTTPSRYLQEAMQPYCDNIQLIPNAIDLQNYHFRLRENPQTQLVWLRAINHLYNPMMAVKVVHELKKTFPEIMLEMIGSVKEQAAFEEIKAYIDQHNLRKNITLVGAIAKADVPHYLDKNDIFLNTTTVDNTPVSVIEAMACGLCIVSTEVGGIPYLLTHQEDALLVPSSDVTAMVKSVQRVITTPDLAKTLSKNANCKAMSFAWQQILVQWDSLLTEIQRNGSHG